MRRIENAKRSIGLGDDCIYNESAQTHYLRAIALLLLELNEK